MIRSNEPSIPPKSGQAPAKPDPHPKALHEIFRKFAQKMSLIVGSAWTFTLAALAIVIWAILGPHYHFSDTWQLIINTGTTIVTFLMVFLIQNTQNRDARAIHLKLDELIRGLKGARNKMVDLEDCTDEELDALEREMRRVRERARTGHLHRSEEADAARAQHAIETIADSPGRNND